MLSPRVDAFPHARDEAPLFGGRFLLPIGAVWGLAALILLAVRWHAIATHNFADVDDQLRLVEVRDWLNGQSFYDVTQYRMNQPWGAPMHWSRLVDMPLAALYRARIIRFSLAGSFWQGLAPDSRHLIDGLFVHIRRHRDGFLQHFVLPH